MVNGDWGPCSYPFTPGHEICGIAKAVGNEVTKFKVGDHVLVGCFVESCRGCDECQHGLQNHCPSMVMTYGTPFPEGKGSNYEKAVGNVTSGGYSTAITVNEDFCFHLPDKMEPEYAGILLCAGITMFSPLNRHILEKGGGKGKRVGIVGFGGLGMMGVKQAKAMGAHVTVFSRNDKKKAQAEEMGADLLVHADEDAVKAAARAFDVILDTVAVHHEIARKFFGGVVFC